MSYKASRVFCFGVLLLSGLPAIGEDFAIKDRKPFAAEKWVAMSNELLDTLRGGFETNNGLSVSFGFVRTITINGDVVSQARFNLPDLSNISAEQAKLVSMALSGAQIVQNGAGNSVGSNNTPQAIPAITVVQNSLDQQAIQSLTVIDSAVNSLGFLKSINVLNTLKDALFGATRIH